MIADSIMLQVLLYRNKSLHESSAFRCVVTEFESDYPRFFISYRKQLHNPLTIVYN